MRAGDKSLGGGRECKHTRSLRCAASGEGGDSLPGPKGPWEEDQDLP